MLLYNILHFASTFSLLCFITQEGNGSIPDNAHLAVITYLLSGQGRFCVESDTLIRVMSLRCGRSTAYIRDAPRKLKEAFPTLKCSADDDEVNTDFKKYPFPVSSSD
jgi:hypothetical protein